MNSVSNVGFALKTVKIHIILIKQEPERDTIAAVPDFFNPCRIPAPTSMKPNKKYGINIYFILIIAELYASLSKASPSSKILNKERRGFDRAIRLIARTDNIINAKVYPKIRIFLIRSKLRAP